MDALIGRKLGMTRIFAEDGVHVPVTVIEAGPCSVVQVRATDVQLGFGTRKAKRTPKAMLGHVKRAGLETAHRMLRSFPAERRAAQAGRDDHRGDLRPGRPREGDRRSRRGAASRAWCIAITSTAARRRHGNTRHRKPGSIAPGTDPSRIIKGKRMPGHMGARRTTAVGPHGGPGGRRAQPAVRPRRRAGVGERPAHRAQTGRAQPP